MIYVVHQSHADRTPGLVFTIGRSLVRPYLFLRYKPIVSGSEKFPKDGAVLIVSNHLSAIDTVLIPSFSPRKVQFLAKSSLFEGRLKSWFFKGIGAVPVFRETGSPAQTALEAGKKVLLSGSVFAIFPEGSRSKSGLLMRGRSGAAWLALATEATVLPVGLIGTDRKRDELGTMPRMEIRFGDPLDLSDLKELKAGVARREATERIMKAIALLSGQSRSDEYAPLDLKD